MYAFDMFVLLLGYKVYAFDMFVLLLGYKVYAFDVCATAGLQGVCF